MRATFSAVFALGVLGLAGCQGPDVGQACTIQAVGEVDLNKTSVPADFFESGNLSCDNLVCIKSPDQSAGSKVKSNPYCSKACVSNSDCFESDTGLVCRPVTVDPNFIKTLPQETQDQYQLLLGQISFSSYCAAPLQ
ncbi:MAG: hypothetical protein A2V77_13355 [Anaeromyxobacter sp. RBG_16_69_14]|nr:MAG: hypothetical protein A2V77_13355 [Anaeromyxobacter sp. RBG_16_69_14]